MANLTESLNWIDGIYQIETLDDVEGGPEGVANRQALQLAARTQWLKAQLTELFEAGYLDIDDITGMLASEADAVAGIADNKLMTPHRVAQAIAALATIAVATETVAGKTRFATSAETLAGALNSVAVHPAGVHAVFQQLLTQITGSAPAVLDTFYEFAAALGNNPNYAADMATALAAKLTQTQGDARYVQSDALASRITRQILPCAASVATNALTVTIPAQSIDFRAANLTDGSVNTRTIGAALALTVPAGVQLGTVAGAAETLAILALDNAGVVEPAVCNIKALSGLDESSLISTSAIGAALSPSVLDALGDGSCKALYRFEGNANDVSGNYNGTATSVSYSTGAFGQYMQTSGAAGSRVTVPWSLLSGTASRSISFRFYIDQNQSTIALLGAHYDGNNRGFALTYTGAGTASSIADGGTVTQHAFHLFSGGAANSDNFWNIPFAEQAGWHQGAISIDTSTGIASLWVDKTLVGTITSTALKSFNPSYTAAIPLGEEPYGGIHTVCKMDQVRFFNRALVQADVEKLYAEGGADQAIIYSATARTGLPFRVVGKVTLTQPVAGQWSAAPTLVQGGGKLSLDTPKGWQTVSRISGTTYYNTTGRSITFQVSSTPPYTTLCNGYFQMVINNGPAITIAGYSYAASGSNCGGGIEIPAGASYVFTAVGAGPYSTLELR